LFHQQLLHEEEGKIGGFVHCRGTQILRPMVEWFATIFNRGRHSCRQELLQSPGLVGTNCRQRFGRKGVCFVGCVGSRLLAALSATFLAASSAVLFAKEEGDTEASKNIAKALSMSPNAVKDWDASMATAVVVVVVVVLLEILVPLVLQCLSSLVSLTKSMLLSLSSSALCFLLLLLVPLGRMEAAAVGISAVACVS
jgi:hypothetical protein